MYSMVKRVSVFALALLTFVMGVVVPYRRAEAATTYNNATYTSAICNIDSSGHLDVGLTVSGIKGITTKISVELYVEKRILGVFWSRVNIGYPNNTWTDSNTGINYNNTFSTNLSSNGTYRVTVTFIVSGSGGSDDTIVQTPTCSY